MLTRIIAAAALATLALSGSAFAANTTLRRTTVVTPIIVKSTVVTPTIVKAHGGRRIVPPSTNGAEISMIETQSVVSNRAVSLATTTGIARSMSPCKDCLKNIR
jgi:hypothetical protein